MWKWQMRCLYPCFQGQAIQWGYFWSIELKMALCKLWGVIWSNEFLPQNTPLKVYREPFFWNPSILRGILSLCSSVCLSVTSRYCVQTNEDTIVRFSASGTTIPLVSGEWSVFGIRRESPPAGALKWDTTMSVEKIWPIIGHNLETVQDRQ